MGFKQNTWVKVYRSLLDWEWYKHGPTKDVFLHLLLTANYEDSRYQGHLIPRGSVVVGRILLAESLGISERQVRTALEHLKSTNEITIKSTNKFSIVTLVKYEEYQMVEEQSTIKSTSNESNNRPTIDQQSTTSKEDKKKEDKKNTLTAWKVFVEEQVKEKHDSPVSGEDAKDYLKLYAFMEGHNATHLLTLKKLMTLEEFVKLRAYCSEQPKVSVRDLILSMINNPGYFPSKGKGMKMSLYLTARDWARMRKEPKHDK